MTLDGLDGFCRDGFGQQTKCVLDTVTQIYLFLPYIEIGIVFSVTTVHVNTMLVMARAWLT